MIHHVQIRGALRAIAATVLLLALGCNKSHTPPSAESSAPAAFASPQAQQQEKVELASALVSILQNAHRGGSIQIRGSCATERQMVDHYSLSAPVQLEPLREALNSISRQYPQITWRDSGALGVRVSDSSMVAGLLKIRIKDFILVEDRGPEAALAVLWRRPEVIGYMASHNVRFARNVAPPATRRKRAVVVLQMKNSTVQEIVERILAGYPAQQGSGGKLWLYRECRSGADTLVELRIL